MWDQGCARLPSFVAPHLLVVVFFHTCAVLMATMAAPQLTNPSESEVVLALGSRTTMLHPEIKRHRGWWREILHREVPRRQAERARAVAAPQVCG